MRSTNPAQRNLVKVSGNFMLLLLVILVLQPIVLLRAQSDDHPLLARFPDSEIIDVEFEADSNYRLVLGSLTRTRGIVVPEQSERLRGDITKIIYEISEEFDGNDVYAFFQEQIQEKGYEVMFSCAGRECGSSNYWANDVFQNRVLYGPERNQFYLALQASPTDHLILYIITRSNRRLYTYLEVIQESGTAPPVNLVASEILLTIEEQGSAILPGLEFVNDRQLVEETDLRAVVAELNAEVETDYYVVAHLSGPQDLDQLLNRSTVRAQTVRQHLINLGVDAGRLEARGVGPLSPSCSQGNCGERVELVPR